MRSLNRSLPMPPHNENSAASAQNGRKLLGILGANLITSYDRVGLGTGSTAEEFIRALAKRVRGGLMVNAFASSKKSAHLATSLGMPCQNIAKIASLDIAVDGADQISPDGLMIKGGGGALLREKVMGLLAKRHVILATWAKLAAPFGSFALPVEILPLTWHFLKERLARFGQFQLRYRDGRRFVSDNGNWIVDLTPPNPNINWQELHSRLKGLCGVVETGLFFETEPEFYLAQPDLEIERWKKGNRFKN